MLRHALADCERSPLAERCVREVSPAFTGAVEALIAKAIDVTDRKIARGALRGNPVSYLLAVIRGTSKEEPEIKKWKTKPRDEEREAERARIRREAKERGETLTPAEVEALVFVDTNKPAFRRMQALEHARRTDTRAPAWTATGTEIDRRREAIRRPKRGETFDGDLPSVGDALLDTVVGDDVDLSANPEVR